MKFSTTWETKWRCWKTLEKKNKESDTPVTMKEMPWLTHWSSWRIKISENENVILKNFLSFYLSLTFYFTFPDSCFYYFPYFAQNNYPLQSSLEIIHAGKESVTAFAQFFEIIRGNSNRPKNTMFGAKHFLCFLHCNL